MARKYRRDARGRFASAGYSGQTSGRGARLTATGTRAGGGAKIKAAGVQGTVRKGRTPQPKVSVMPKAPARGSMTATLRGMLGDMARRDAAHMRSLERDFGIKIGPTPAGRAAGTAARARVQGTATRTGSVAQTLRAGLRELAQSDARMLRGINELTKPKALGGSERKAIGGAKPRLPGARKKRKP